MLKGFIVFVGILAALMAGVWILRAISEESPVQKATAATKATVTPAAPTTTAARTAPAHSEAPTTFAAPLDSLLLYLGGGVTMKLVLIPAGKFLMGEEKNQHEVAISKPFYMGMTEVTQAQYEAVTGANPSDFKGATNPVGMIRWTDAAEFCKKLSDKTHQAVRLPTEAEWEYACRAGSTTRFCFGDADKDLGDYAWFVANSNGATHPVGQKKPNAWGLFDIHGCMWEWCMDWYGDYPNGAVTDPEGPASGTYRVLRGGAWLSSPNSCRSAKRNYSSPQIRSNYYGFRVAMSVSAPGP